jgi:mRNA interferase RelE/StbE
MKTIIFSHVAAKELDALSAEGRETVLAGIHRYAMFGQGDVKQLNGRAGYRLRTGAYRVIFSEDRSTILAITLGRRTTTTYRRT